MSAIVNYCRNTLVSFVYSTAKEMHTRSSCIVGCARTLRFIQVVSARTISTRPLPRTNMTSKLKNPPTDSCDHGKNYHVGPSATQSRTKPPLARRAGDEGRVRSQAEQTRNPIGLSTDRFVNVARSSESNADDRVRATLPPPARSGRGHSAQKISCKPGG